MIESTRQRAPEKITPEDALMANALLGGGLSSAAEEHLIAASLSYHHDEVAEKVIYARQRLWRPGTRRF